MTIKHWQPERRIIVISLCVILTVWLSLFLVRLTAPFNLLEHYQDRSAAYILDAAVNGNWIIQRDDRGDVCRKPPLYTWMGALLTRAFGRISYFTISFPSALGVLGCSILIWRFGSRYFGVSAAFLAALMYIVSPYGAKMICLAKTDSLFAFTVSMSAFLCFSAWIRGRGWTWFWLAAAATLTKTPLGVILAASGLLAYVWERKELSRPGLRGSHWLGVALFLVLTLGWFVLTYWQVGRPLIDRMINQDLVYHALWFNHEGIPCRKFYKPLLYFLSRFAPWSILACMGFWRVWKHPAINPNERMFERFLLCYFMFSLAAFSYAPHQRADLLSPLIPAAALLAGRELSYCANIVLTRHLLRWVALIWLVAPPIWWVYYNMVYSQKEAVIQTMGVQEVTQKFKARFGKNFPLLYANAPIGLQFYFNTNRPRISLREAAERLSGKESVMVAVQDIAGLKVYLSPGIKIYEAIRWPKTG
ncbi:MAG: ArnT family glycosyltransferase [Candidatus Scalindua sp.]